MSKKVALIFSTYNSSEFVGNCLRSCLNQDYEDFVVIVSDDGSSDNTCEVLETVGKFANNFYLIRLPHGERGIARITAIDKARALGAEYLVILDSDMILLDGFIKDSINYFDQHQDVGALVIPELAYSDYNNFVSKVKVFERNTLNNAGEDWTNSSIEAARFWRMEAYDSTGGFNPNQISFEEIQPSIRYYNNGGKIKRATFTGVKHDEKHVTYNNLMTKKRYYFSVMNKTIDSEDNGASSAISRYYFFRPVLYRKENLKRYLKHPLLTLGMVNMYGLLTFVAVEELAKSKLKK